MNRIGRPELHPDATSLSVRRGLREATHAEHVRLNQHPLLSGITRPDYALLTYQQVLAAYYHFYRELEACIDRALQAGVSTFSYANRCKLPWLASDLRYFGIDPDAAAWRPAIAPQRFELLDEGQLLGTLYTIEGSSLGGQVIVRHVAAHLGLTPDTGARFFYGYGEQTMPLWGRFEAFINTALTDEGACRRAQDAAKSTFSRMESVLDDYLARHESASRA